MAGRLILRVTIGLMGMALATACSGGASSMSSSLKSLEESGSVIRAAVSESFGSACAAGATCTYSGAAENQSVSASCASGVMSVSSANYGMNSASESCLSYAASACNGQSSCSLNFNNGSCGGDPDYGIVKAASMTVSCSSPSVSFGTACAAGSSCSYSGASENQTVSVSCSAGVITANSASYGQGSNSESCLAYAASACNGKSSCSLDFSNGDCGGDPDYGVVKAASLSISCSAPVATPTPTATPSSSSLAFGTACAAGSTCNYAGAAENASVSLSCASGSIAAISASYGMGSKSESCLSYLSSACNGKSACSLNFNNSSCGGDPDYGIVKAASASISCSSAAASSSLPAAIANLNFKQTFDDEFMTMDISSGGTFDGSKWYNGTEQCCMSDTSGNLPAVMYPSQVNGVSVDPYSLISGGGLNITLSKVNNVWYSGVMTSVDNGGQGFSQQYGYFEITARLSGDPGTWPSFWLLNTSQKQGNPANGGEIDVFESYGYWTNGFCTTFHDWGGGTTPYYNCGINAPNILDGNYHKFGMLWTASTTTIYFDDVQVAQTTTPSVMKQPYYMLVDQGLGGGWPTDQTPSSSTMKVKSVKVWASQ